MNLHLIACHVLWRELSYYASMSPHTFMLTFLRQGLHNTPEKLREQLQETVNAVSQNGDLDAIVLGYGLCCNGLLGLTAGSKRIVAPRAHDCITFLLGSKERYREYFDSHPGTYWYSPGWIETTSMPSRARHDKMLIEYTERFGADDAQYLVEQEMTWQKTYNNAAYVDLGAGGNDRHKQFTRDCAEWLGWGCDLVEGDAGLVRDLLDGRWDDDRFLIVEPGMAIAPTYDEKIITLKDNHSKP
ncbi:MAG: DUF1638 domain-containing protein [bacterium]